MNRDFLSLSQGNNAWNNGAVLVASAMNDGTSGTAHYPAAYDNVMAVAATDENDQHWSYSNSGDWVDVAAPGVNIYSTVPSEWMWMGRYGGWQAIPQYDYYSGTSMAAPQVSGLAGLILSKNEWQTNQQVRYSIEHTAIDLGTAGKDPQFGWGRIDACYALNSCKLLVNGG